VTDETSRSDAVAEQEASAKSEARASEAAAIRRRWITLGEVLAVVAAVISGLTLWNSWSERADNEAAKSAEASRSSLRAARLVLTATAANDRKLVLRPSSPDQSIQSQSVTFPSSLGVTPAQTTGEPRLEAAWFADALEKSRNEAGLPDDSHGDERMPVAITTRYLVEGEPHEDFTIYDVGYSVAGRLLSGHTVTLRGLSLVSRVKNDDAQKLLDARWAKLRPRSKRSPS
jgi:hypothetical protein